MTAPDPQAGPTASRGPVSHTTARHVALATVAAGTVSYDREHARWTLATRRRSKPVRELRGAEQRTLRDLLDSELITYTTGEGPATVRTTPKGTGALALWGTCSDRLQGVAPTR